MGKFVLKNAHGTINAVDLSTRITRLNLNYGAAILNDTTMSATADENIAGLVNWDADLEFTQDHAASNVDATFFPLVGAAAFTVSFKPDAGATAVGNPAFTGSALVESYNPIGGSVGEVSKTSVKLKGTGVLTRATS